MFSAASPALRAAIERTAIELTLAPGAMLFSQGDDADGFYILDAGEIEIGVLSPGGRKLTLDVMTPVEIFGEIGLFAGKRTASAAAIGKVKLRLVRRSDLMAAIQDKPDLALQFIDVLCERLRVVSEKLEERSFMPLPARLARRLTLRRQAGAGRRQDPGLAGGTGGFRRGQPRGGGETLAVWKAEGWIDLSRGAVQVLDKDALEDIAESFDD